MRSLTTLTILSLSISPISFAQTLKGKNDEQEAQSALRQSSIDEQQIRRLIREVAEATVRRDTATLDRLYATDYTITFQNGTVMNRRERLETLKAPLIGDVVMTALTQDDVRVRIYGGAAIAQYRSTQEGQIKGQPYRTDSRVLNVYAKLEGRWQLVAQQLTWVSGSN